MGNSGLYLDLRQIIYVLSDALDLVGVSDLEHGKRVAYMAATIAYETGLDQEHVEDLFHAALLHDCGVSSTREHMKIMGRMNPRDEHDHCVRGADLLASFKPLIHLAPIVRHHHHHWERLQGMDLPPGEAFNANCIYLADRVDTLRLAHPDQNVLLARDDIRDEIGRRRGTYFAPELVDAFLKVSAAESFWLTLASQPLRSYLDRAARKHMVEEIDVKELKQLATMFARIVDAKSRFTAEHSLGVACVARFLARKSGLREDRCDLVEVAGLLHDLGKLVVPDDILDKPGPLDREERATIMQHTFYTFQILKRIERFDEIAEWAAFHHETLSGDGYPFHHDASRLAPEARIMAVADVVQACAQERPYRPRMPTEQILSILSEMVANGKLDSGVVALVNDNVSECMETAISVPLTA